jgi:hypothetical protein
VGQAIVICGLPFQAQRQRGPSSAFLGFLRARTTPALRLGDFSPNRLSDFSAISAFILRLRGENLFV